MLFILKLLCSILIISNRIAIKTASSVDWCSIYSNQCQTCTNQVISCNSINTTNETNNMTLTFGSQTHSITLTHFETFDSLNFTSSTNLNRLVSLNLTSNNIVSIDDEENAAGLLLRQASNLVNLNLANNSLRNTFQFDSPLLCSLKNLTSLDLAQNHLENVDYRHKCSALSHLTSLNLKSNKLKTMSVTFLQKLSEWRANNRNFTVWLGGNEFRCNCVLLPFFKFLRANPSIVADVDTIVCSNESSWSTSLAFNRRRVIDSNLDHICDHTTTITTNFPKMKSTWKWKTTNFSIIPVHYSRGNVNSRTLLIFVVCSFLFGCCVLLLVKPKCFCLKNKQQQQHHPHLQLQQDDDLTLGQTSTASNRTLILADDDDQRPQKRLTYLFKVQILFYYKYLFSKRDLKYFFFNLKEL